LEFISLILDVVCSVDFSVVDDERPNVITVQRPDATLDNIVRLAPLFTVVVVGHGSCCIMLRNNDLTKSDTK
jgi:hypothetical protein